MKNLLKKYIKEALLIESTKHQKLAACVFVISPGGKILAVSRKDDPNDFGMPGGKVEPGEEPWEAATRECKEETGLDAKLISYIPFHDQIDDNGYHCYTFKAVVDGNINTDEDGVVRWVKPEVLMAGSFGPYNKIVLRKAGFI